jgi:hypothetical protein
MPNASHLRRLCALGVWLAAALVFARVTGHGQEKGEKVPEGNAALPKEGIANKGVPQAQDDEFSFHDTWLGVRLAASMQMLAVPHPIAVFGPRLAAAENPLTWPDWQFTLDSPLPLSLTLLKDLKDKTPVPNIMQRPLSDLKPDERA